MKEIKFSLFVGNKEVSDLESLRKNVNFNDILAHFKSGKLAKWLKAQGYEQEYEKVANLSKDSLDEDVIIDLAKILKSPHSSDENQLKEISQYVRYSKDKQEFFARIQAGQKTQKEILTTYHKDFFALVLKIIAHKNDISTIKSSLNLIIKDYDLLFFLHFHNIFGAFSYHAPLAIFMCFCIEDLAIFFLPENLTKNNWEQYFAKKLGTKAEFENNYLKTEFFILHKDTLDCQLYLDAAYKNAKNDFEENNLLHSTKEATSSIREWCEKEPKEKKILVINAPKECCLRNAGNVNESPIYQARTKEGTPIPLVLNGLDFRKSNSNDLVVYLEV